MTKVVLLSTSSLSLSRKYLQVSRYTDSIRVLASPKEEDHVKALKSQYPNQLNSVVYGDRGNRKDVQAALEGCTSAILVSSPSMSTTMVEDECAFVDAAFESNIPNFVKVSIPHRQQLHGENILMGSGGDHPAIEAHMKQAMGRNISSTTKAAIVRTTSFMQSILQDQLLEMILGSSTISLPFAEDTEMALVDEMDVAKVLHKLVLDHEQRESWVEYQLTGPDALSWKTIIQMLSSTFHRPIRFSAFPRWAVQPSMWIKGKSATEIHEVLQRSRWLAAGHERLTTTDIKNILGEEPAPFAKFLQEQYDALMHRNE